LSNGEPPGAIGPQETVHRLMEHEPTQQEFIARIRRALGKTLERAAPPDRSTARQRGPDDERVGHFVAMAEDAGMTVHRRCDKATLAGRIETLARACQARRLLLLADEIPDGQALAERLRTAGFELLDASDPDAPFEADIGITGAVGAIAETGSIVLRSGPDHRRLASVAPPVHIAIVSAEAIVPDLLDWAGTERPDPLPANEVLVTGPSKTADIELNLVKGVHGPGQVHILLLED